MNRKDDPIDTIDRDSHITLEKNGKTLNVTPGEASTDRIHAIPVFSQFIFI